MSEEDREILVRIETTVNLMYTRLYGNGRPGEIETINGKIDRVNAKLYFFSGVLTVLSGIVHYIVHKFSGITVFTQYQK